MLNCAVEMGYTYFDTAALYGFGHNESLLGKALKPYQNDLVIGSKCGLFKDADGKRELNGSPENIKKPANKAFSGYSLRLSTFIACTSAISIFLSRTAWEHSRNWSRMEKPRLLACRKFPATPCSARVLLPPCNLNIHCGSATLKLKY